MTTANANFPTLAALKTLAKSRPNLIGANYTTATTWHRDRRVTQRDRRRCLALATKITAIGEHYLARQLARNAGRLSVDSRGVAWYCAGQYYATEFRDAIASLLDAAIAYQAKQIRLLDLATRETFAPASDLRVVYRGNERPRPLVQRANWRTYELGDDGIGNMAHEIGEFYLVRCPETGTFRAVQVATRLDIVPGWEAARIDGGKFAPVAVRIEGLDTFAVIEDRVRKEVSA